MEKLLLVFLFSFSEDLVFEEINEEMKIKIEYYLKNKVDINEASLDEIIDIPFINSDIAKEILQRRDKERFKFVEELLTLPSISPLLFLRIKDFFVVGKEKRPRDKVSLIFKYIYLYPADTSYLGSPSKIYIRCNSKFKDFSFGIVTEKDYYERNYFDYYTLFLSYKNFLIGGYYITNGLGLLFGEQGFVYKFGGINEVGMRIKPHLSSNENTYLFGGIFNLNYLIPFFSYNKLDGIISDSIFIPNFSGYHRTDSEIEKKDKGDEFIYGVGLKILNFNGIFVYQRYKPFFPKYANDYAFSIGTEKKIGRTKFILEFAKSNGSSFGIGVKTPVGLQGLYRFFTDDFFSLRSGPLEKREGIYFFFERKLLELNTTIYTDFIKDSLDFINETGFSFNYRPIRDLNMRFLIKIKNEKLSGNSEFCFLEKMMDLRFKVFFTLLQEERGFGTFIECGYKYFLNIKIRYTIYNTDSYKSAVYIYEDDLPGEYSTEPYYSKGKNIYIFMRSEKFNIYFKSSINIKEDLSCRLGLGLHI